MLANFHWFLELGGDKSTEETGELLSWNSGDALQHARPFSLRLGASTVRDLRAVCRFDVRGYSGEDMVFLRILIIFGDSV